MLSQDMFWIRRRFSQPLLTFYSIIVLLYILTIVGVQPFLQLRKKSNVFFAIKAILQMVQLNVF